MAVITYTETPLKTLHDKGVLICTYGVMANNDTGTPIEVPGFADRSVQVIGTHSAASSLNIQGSNDGTNWATLTDPQGNDLEIVAADKQIEQILELTRYIRPTVTGGDGSTALQAIILLRRK
jgi:hypothetical protein